MIGSDPSCSVRWDRLTTLKDAGYRGIVSVTALFAADIYEVRDDDIEFLGRIRYKDDGWMCCNFARLYKKWVTNKKKNKEDPAA